MVIHDLLHLNVVGHITRLVHAALQVTRSRIVPGAAAEEGEGKLAPEVRAVHLREGRRGGRRRTLSTD